jgi:5'(3')-deoxyribonucleotidase
MVLGHNFVFERFMEHMLCCFASLFVQQTCTRHYSELTDVMHLHWLLKLLYFIEYTVIIYTTFKSVVTLKILWINKIY